MSKILTYLSLSNRVMGVLLCNSEMNIYYFLNFKILFLKSLLKKKKAKRRTWKRKEARIKYRGVEENSEKMGKVKPAHPNGKTFICFPITRVPIN